jgi:teichuronic acid biosynthesis glycosyltransferase TuaG
MNPTQTPPEASRDALSSEEQRHAYSDTLVSVVMPNYNSARFLPDTIASIQAQTHTHWELIIVDDCSSDDSVAVVERFQALDPRIRLVRLPERSGGPARPRNVGIDNARGEFITFLDSDDLFHRQRFTILLQVIHDEQVDACSTNLIRFQSIEELAPHQQATYSIPLSRQAMAADSPLKQFRRITHEMVLRRHFTPCLLLRRSVLGSVRLSESPSFRGVEDGHFWMLIHQHCVPYSLKLSVPLYFYRQVHGSLSHNKLAMFRRVVEMYTTYTIGSKALGWRGWRYVALYVVRSVLNRAITRFGLPFVNTIDG